MKNRVYKNPRTIVPPEKEEGSLLISLRKNEKLNFSGDWLLEYTHVTYIVIYENEGGYNTVNLKGIERLTNLTSLYIPRYVRLLGVDYISQLKELKSLCISAPTNIEYLDWVKDLPLLESLRIQANKIKSIECLRGNKNIKSIELREADIVDISPLFTMENLQSIDLYSVKHIDFDNFPFIIQENDNGIVTFKNKHEVRLYLNKNQREQLYLHQQRKLNKIPEGEKVIQL